MAHRLSAAVARAVRNSRAFVGAAGAAAALFATASTGTSPPPAASAAATATPAARSTTSTAAGGGSTGDELTAWAWRAEAAQRARGGAAGPPRCRPIIICGPSGAGKSTLVAKLRSEFPDSFGFSVSHTTRDPRPGEVNGVHYHFVSREVMEREIGEGMFLEHATVHGNLYGTSKAEVESVTRQGRVCILDIDIQGVQTCHRIGFDVGMYVFLAPPTVAELEARLRGRGTETEERIVKRLATAKSELTVGATLPWDLVVVNDDLERAYALLRDATAPPRAAAAALRAAAAAGKGGGAASS